MSEADSLFSSAMTVRLLIMGLELIVRSSKAELYSWARSGLVQTLFLVGLNITQHNIPRLRGGRLAKQNTNSPRKGKNFPGQNLFRDYLHNSWSWL